MKYLALAIILLTNLTHLSGQRTAHILSVKLPTRASDVPLTIYYKGEALTVRDGSVLLYDKDMQYSFTLIVLPPQALSQYMSGSLIYLTRDSDEPCLWYTCDWQSDDRTWCITTRTENLPTRLPEHACVVLAHPRYIASVVSPAHHGGTRVRYLPEIIFKQKLKKKAVEEFREEMLEARMGVALDMNTIHAQPRAHHKKHTARIQVSR